MVNQRVCEKTFRGSGAEPQLNGNEQFHYISNVLLGMTGLSFLIVTKVLVKRKWIRNAFTVFKVEG